MKLRKAHRFTSWLLTLAMLLTLIPASMISASAAGGGIIWTTNHSAGYTTLQDAYDDAKAGDGLIYISGTITIEASVETVVMDKTGVNIEIIGSNNATIQNGLSDHSTLITVKAGTLTVSFQDS